MLNSTERHLTQVAQMRSKYSTRWGIITGPPSFNWHNLVTIWFIYTKISGDITEGMLSLQIWK